MPKKNSRRREVKKEKKEGVEKKPAAKKEDFSGRTSDLNGHIYSYGRGQRQDEYTSTTKELAIYVGKEYRHGGDVKTCIEDLKLEHPDKPKMPVDISTNVGSKIEWQAQYNDWNNRKRVLNENLESLYSLILGQCTLALQEKIKEGSDYGVMNSKKDAIALLKKIRGVSFNNEINKYPEQALLEALRKFNRIYQKKDETNSSYHERFMNGIEVMKVNGGSPGYYGSLLDAQLDRSGLKIETATIEQKLDAKNTSVERYLAVQFLLSADRDRYGKLVQELENNYSRGEKFNQWPNSISAAYDLMQTFRHDPKFYMKSVQDGEAGLMFTTTSSNKNNGGGGNGDGRNAKPKGGKSDKTKDITKVRCFKCQELGHYANDCPNKKVVLTTVDDADASKKTTAVAETNCATVRWCDNDNDETKCQHVAFMFVNAVVGAIGEKVPWWWILLDNCSTVNLFKSKRFLVDIYKSDEELTVYSNGGSLTTRYRGTLPGFGEVWYSPDAIANILSFSLVFQRFDIDLDKENNSFIVHGKNNKLVFKNDGGSLYHYDTTNPLQPKGRSGRKIKNVSFAESGVTQDIVCVDTVQDKMKLYSKKEIDGAKKARRLYIIMDRPSKADFLNRIKKNLLTGSLVTVRDVEVAEDIFGQDVGALKGKSVRKQPEAVRSNYVDLPHDILTRHQRIELAADIMFVNTIPFMVTISRHIMFTSAECLKSRKIDTIKDTINNSIIVYKQRGLTVTTLYMDREFEPLRGYLMEKHGIQLNTTSADEHVPEVERRICVIKEHFRAEYNTTPIKRYTIEMIIAKIGCIVFWLNYFPATNGVSQELSPRVIVTGSTISFDKISQIGFGDYAQVYQRNKATNSTDERTVGAICLGPAGNVQGGYWWLSMKTGRHIHRKQFTLLPMPSDVVKRIDELAILQKQPKGVNFFDRNMTPIYLEQGSSISHTDSDLTVHGSTPMPGSRSGAHNIDGNKKVNIADVDEEIENDDYSMPELIDRGYDSESSSDESSENDEYDNFDEDKLDRAHEEKLRNDQFEFDLKDMETAQETATKHVEPTNVLDDEAYLKSIQENRDDESISSEDVKLADDIEAQDTTESVLSENIADIEDNIEEGRVLINDLSDDKDEISPPPLVQHETESDEEESSVEDDGAKKNKSGEGYWSKKPTFVSNYNTRSRTNKHKDRGKTKKNGALFGKDVALMLITTIQRVAAGYGITLSQQHSLKRGMKLFGNRGAEAVLAELEQMHLMQTFEPQLYHSLTPKQKQQALESLMMLTEKKSGVIKGRMVADGRKQRTYITKEEALSPTVATESVLLTCVIDAHEKRDVAVTDVPGAFLHSVTDEYVIVKFRGQMVDLMVKIAPTVYERFVHVTASGEKILYLRLKKAMYGTLRAALIFWKNLTGSLLERGFELNPYDPCVANKMVHGKQLTVLWHVDDLKVSHVDKKVVTQFLDWLSRRFGKLKTTRGMKHVYLGMELDFSEPGEVKLQMPKYLEEAIDEFPEELIGTATSPAGAGLFKVCKDDEKLQPAEAEILHSIVAKLLYTVKRARPDIALVVAWLCTRVMKSTCTDWEKLKRLLKYLKGTIDLPLRLTAGDMTVINWYIDGAFAVHEDMRSHSGATMILGKGSVYSGSSKQKLNVRSSTETEIVAVDDYMTPVIRADMFMRAQGYKLRILLHQDNTSSISLEKNAFLSVGKRSRHIDIRYFFITDRYQKGEIEIQHTSTHEMIADYFTKPLQGAKFLKFRNIIMNEGKEDINGPIVINAPKECVE